MLNSNFKTDKTTTKITQIENLLSQLLNEESINLISGTAVDEELSDIYNKLRNLADKLTQYKKQVDIQGKLSHVRADLWRLAAQKPYDESSLIDKLLQLAGTALHLSRTSYYILRSENSNSAVCVKQWHSLNTPSAIHASIPLYIVKLFLGKDHVAFCENDLLNLHPEISEIFKQYNVKSFLAVPYGNIDNPDGYFTFSDCEIARKWKPNEIEILVEVSKIVTAKASQIKAENVLKSGYEELEHVVKQRTSELARLNEKLEQDISERQIIQHALSSEKERLSVTLRCLSDAVIAVNNENKIILFNVAAEQLTGYTSKEVQYALLNDIIQAFQIDTNEPVPDLITHSLQEVVGENRCQLHLKDGSKKIVSYRGAVIRGNLGEQQGTVLILCDITERLKLEEELFRTRKLESVGLLAGGIAHNFNNYLAGMMSNLFLAKVNCKGNDETVRLINEAEKAAYNASKLTKQLLTFSKGGNPVKEEISLKDLIEDTVGFCLSGSQADYILDISDSLCEVKIDKGQIDQALSNLIANAEESMPDGGLITIKAENISIDNCSDYSLSQKKLSGLNKGNYVKISVRDEGIGIPSDNIQHIFDPYFTTKEDRAGLGLTTVYSIIKKHGGYVDVQSVPGNGSTFSIYIPSINAPDNKTLSPKGTEKIQSGRVLIMDDDEIVRTVLQKLLDRAGFDVIAVSNGNDAIQAYRKIYSEGDKIMLSIMDLTIPGGMGGKEAIKHVREIDPSARVIVFSGYSNDTIMSNFKDFGFDGVLPKPFTIEDFSKIISEIANK